ncbi:unnamed protein product, partial [marine sediment metagenome]
RLGGKPITRVENYCASGMDAFRNACFGVASGAYDVALACGVEKLMDEGGRGLPGTTVMGHPVLPRPSAPAMFCLLATRSFHEFGWQKEDLARVAVKNHENGYYHPNPTNTAFAFSVGFFIAEINNIKDIGVPRSPN